MATDPLSVALDRFDAPAPSSDLADRILAAATRAGEGLPPQMPPRHDRSRLWRRGRQVVIGTIAAGVLSAAAVASGLLGAAGIHVPVLTAMFAPVSAPAPKPAPKHHRATLVRQAAAAPVAPAVVAEAPPAINVLIGDRERIMAMRQARRDRFVMNHPRAAAVIERRIVARIAERRAAAGLPLGPRALTPDGLPANPMLRARVERRMDALLARRAMMRRAALAQQAQAGGLSSSPQAANPSWQMRADRFQRWQQWRQRRAQAGADQAVDTGGTQPAPTPADPR